MKTPHRRLKTTRGRRQSVLWVMAIVLFGSGALRVTDQVGAATAAQNDRASAPIERADLILGMPLDDQTLPQLLEMFRTREEALLEAEARAAAKEVALADSAKAIADQLAELEAAEEKLASTLAMVDEAASSDLARLSTVFENMKPVDAAALFSEMDPGFAAGFLAMMRPESAAGILSLLEPNVAHTISVMLAGRNAGGPRRE